MNESINLSKFENNSPTIYVSIQNSLQQTVWIQIQDMDSEGERAIRLIEVNASGKYVLSEEGKAFINKIQGPIAVISVAGMYRTGKSYLLNRMILNRSNGFGVGPTVNPCTKGLWCWGKTIAGKTTDGQPINVIVIDTEGIGALDEDQTHDTRIFTLAILAASAFIYNSTGSIDENALQNLSLVVNLTKNIQLNTNQSEEQQDDPEELAKHFPIFYWVVRDFSLQLINSDGEQITPKQYLERALAPQKGFSDDVEQKNRIRRLLSSFFKERQCFTLVRPLVDEKKLQHLDQLDLDQLRPEFVDQVMNFRRRILGRVKPKTFKGKQLDGPMYLCMLNSYVNAINTGAVPNIQNAWNYMCQQKCAQAFEYSLSFFNEQAQKNLRSIFPAQQQFLMEQLKQMKEKACEMFETNSVGDKTKFHLKELRENIEHKIELLRIENQKHSQSTLKNYFKKSIVEIENKLRLRQYQSFDEFMKELNHFYANLLENGPVLPKKEAVFLAMLKKVIPAAAQVFLKDKTQDYRNFKAIADQKEINFQFSIQTLKKQIKQNQQRNKDKLTKLDRQKIELQLELDDLKKATDDFKQKSNIQNQKWQNQLKSNNESYKKKQQAYNEKIMGLNQQISQLQNQIVTMRCEQEKENALIGHKNRQLQTQVEQLKRKQAQTILSLRNLQISNSDNVKVITEQYQKKMKERQIEIRQLKISLTDSEQHSKTIEYEMNQLKTQNEDQLIKLKLSLNKKENEIVKLTKQKQQSEKDLRFNSNEQIQKLKQDLSKLSERNIEIEKQLKSQTQSSHLKERTYETELSVLKQKIEFTQVQAKEYKSQLIKTQREHQQKIATLLEQNSMKQNQSALIEEQSQMYQARISQMKTDYETNTKKVLCQVEELTKQLSDTQLQSKTIKNKLQIQLDQQSRTVKQLKDQLQAQQCSQQQKITSLSQQHKSKQKSFSEKIEKLENQLQQTKQQMQREQRQEHEKSEQAVLLLKNYYEIEKQKLENKIVIEKEKYQRKINQLKFEHQEKLREETMELEAEYQFLKEKFSEMEEELMKEKTNRKIEVDIKNKQIENLQKTLDQIKSKTDNKEVQLLNKIDKIQKQQSNQKQSLYSKIEELLTKQSKSEKERAGLNHSKEQLEKILQMREKNIQELKSELSTIKDKIEADKENEKSARNDMSTKLMQQRVQFEKKTALLTQENQYLKQKIQENEKILSQHQNSTEEKWRKLKEEYGQQLRASREKSQLQLDAIQAKYEKIKKAGKEKEAQMQKSISQLQKQLAISNEKNINFMDKLKTYEQKQSNESEQYSSTLSNLKSSLNKEKQQLKQQLENQQKQRERIETEKNSLIATYQQEKLLLENKNKFLEEGKERYRQDYQDTKSKLDLFMESSRKKWMQEKTNLQLSHSEHVSKVEKKYWQQKQELTQTMKKQQLQYENKLKTLESENRVLSEKLAMQQQNKMGTQNTSDRKLKQMIENEKKLQIQLDRLRNMRESEQGEIQNQQKQKQNLKAKLKQKQDKYRTLQKQKQHLFYEMQKQKAKWKMEKDGILGKTQEQKQMIQKFQRQIEKLQRQNEKLKVQKKCQKTSMQSMTRFSSNFGLDRGMSRLEESVLKQNSNNTSQISDTSIFFKE